MKSTMRRSYEFKHECYAVHEERDYWSRPHFHIAHNKPSFYSNPSNHHDDMALNESPWIRHDEESHDWRANHRVNNDLTMRRNEHRPLGTSTILRPPLGSVKPPSRNGWDHDVFARGSTRESQSLSMINNNRVEAPGTFGGVARLNDYDDDGRIGEGLETLIKGLNGGSVGGVVKKIELEVIQYERSTYGHGALRASQFAPNYPNNATWVKGF